MTAMKATPTLDPEHAQTVTRLWEQAQAEWNAFADTLPRADAEELVTMMLAVHELITIQLLFVVGLDQVRAGQVRDKGPLQRSREHLSAWAKNTPPRKVPSTLAGLGAMGCIAVLERFLEAAANRWIDGDLLDFLLPPGWSGGAAAEAIKLQRGKVKPSHKGGGKKWLRNLERLGCQLHPDLAHVLVSMVERRNRFAHDPPRRADDHRTVSPEEFQVEPFAIFVAAVAFLKGIIETTARAKAARAESTGEGREERSLDADAVDQRAETRCPLCGWRPLPAHRWGCRCGATWNTFDTRGRCPKCNHQWTETMCLACLRTTKHVAWYVESP